MTLAQRVTVNASLLSAGRFINAIIGVFGIGITTRYLGVGEYGALVAALAYISIVNALNDVGVWTIGAREIAKRPDEEQRIVSALFTGGLGISAAAGLFALGLAFLIYPGADHELQRQAIALLLLTVVFAAPAGAASAHFVAHQRAYMGMIASVAQSVVMIVLLVLTVTLDWGYTGVVMAYVVGAAVQGLLMIAFAIPRIKLTPSRDFKLTYALLKAALPLGGNTLAAAIYWRLDVILLSLFVVESEVAQYGLAYKVLDFLVMIPAYITITLLPEFARLAARRDELDRIMQRAYSVMQVGAIPILVFFLTFADEIVRLAGGAGFEDSAPLLRILVVGIALSYLTGLTSQGMIALDRQRDVFVYGALAILPVNAGANLALIPLLGTYGAAIAFLITEIFAFFVVRHVYARFAKVPAFHAPIRTFAAGCIMGLAYGVKLLGDAEGWPAIVVLLVGGIVATFLYVGALYGLRAMPREIHTNLVAPLLGRVRPHATA